ncbi:MAG: diguanylate cyclase [Methylococcaceae bacterium]|nr:diguanylate cyclase [Methylococcaceae bacterium]
MSNSAFKDIYKIKLYELYQEANSALMAEIADLVEPEAEFIAEDFYRRFLNYEPAFKFLNHQDVRSRLKIKMTEWISNIFIMKHSDKDIEQHLENQIQVGSIHARIGVPISLVSYGMTIIKDNISIILINSGFSREKLSRAIMLMDGLIDSAYSLINESYIGDTIVNEKNAQSFRLHISDQNLAFDCERLRTSLLDWMRRVLIALHQSAQALESVPNVRESDFGLWTLHKGELILKGRSELNDLIECIDDIDKNMCVLIGSKRNEEPFDYEMNQLSENVSRASWLLGVVSKEIIDIDSGRDVLTKLFNRRYLDTIMRHEADFSIKHNAPFGVIYVDIDHFKLINDQYGHDNGDTVLSQLAEVLLQRVRAGDFVFRMGGEEFLIILSDMTKKAILRVAEQIRSSVDSHHFELKSRQPLNLTVSLGVALHDGHPDYHITLKKADEGLYYSKNHGRNKVTYL